MKLRNSNKEKKLIIFRVKLFNKSLYAAIVFSALIFAISIVAFFANALVIAIPTLIVSLIQLLAEGYVLIKVNESWINNDKLNYYRKCLIYLFALTLNILGLIYFALTIKKV